MPIEETQRVRHFIVTAGRTGSSLLAAVLADAGADFGMAPPEAWNPTGGEMEHPKAQAMGWHFARAHAISPVKPALPPASLVWDIRRHLAKKRLRELLAKATFVKTMDLDLAIQPTFRLGYFPSLILNYRAFEAQALSVFAMRGHMTAEGLAKRYERTYRNGLLLLHIYGGCVIGYDALVDPGATAWAAPLAEVTGLPREALLASRARRVGPGSPPVTLPVLDAAAARLFAEMEALSDRVIPPSAQALRRWRDAAAPPTKA